MLDTQNCKKRLYTKISRLKKKGIVFVRTLQVEQTSHTMFPKDNDDLSKTTTAD